MLGQGYTVRTVTSSRRVWSWALIALMFVPLSATTSSAVLANDSCAPDMPNRLAAVRGYTFSGTALRVEAADPVHRHGRRLDPAVGVPIYITVRLDHVYAERSDTRPSPDGTNPQGVVLRPGGTLRLYGESCDGIRGLTVGVRYLVSVGTLDGPIGPLSAAWRLVGDRTQLVRMYPQSLANQVQAARRLAAAQTLEAALVLVAPHAALPPTSTLGVAPNQPDIPLGSAIFLVLAGLAGLGVGRTISRRAQAHHI